MEPGSLSVINNAWAQAAFAGLLFAVMAVAIVALWRERAAALIAGAARTDKDRDQRDAAIRADVEATGAFREVGSAVVGLKTEISALRSDLTRGRP